MALHRLADTGVSNGIVDEMPVRRVEDATITSISGYESGYCLDGLA